MVGLPATRHGNTFASFDLKLAPDMTAAKDQCVDVSRGIRWCAFLWGSPGNGKTHLAIAALQAWNRRSGKCGIFWKVPDFLADLRQKMSEGVTQGWGGDGVEMMVRTYSSSAALIVLDDLGVENQTDWANEQLYRILDGRYERRAPTIITSNAPMDRLDPRLRSRFKEGLVLCEGKDVR